MKHTFTFMLVAILAALSLAVAGCSCGDDDDDDDDGAPDDDTGDDDADDDTGDDDADDDDMDDDMDDDDTGDDDTGDDDTGDDDTGDDDTGDTEFSSLSCPISDPESIGSANTVGGGSATTTVDVYVFDDNDCSAIQNADVIHGDTVYQTDVNGHAVVTLTDAEQTITAYAEGYWSWTYKVDAAVMYFRLRPDSFGNAYTDSGDGTFQDEGGSDLGLTNPTLFGLFSNPIYLGVALPGLARADLLSMDFDGLLATDTFDLTLDLGDGPAVTEAPRNIYLPALNLSIPGLFSVTGTNEDYVLPVRTGASVSPIEGFVLSASVGELFDNVGEILAVVACVTGGGDILECVEPLVLPLINDALAFSHVGARPDWNGTGDPSMTTQETGGNTLSINVANEDANFDYLAIFAAEIPNRALLPLGVGIVDSGSVDVDYADVPDGDYLAVVGATDLFASGFTSVNFSFALKYGESIADMTAKASFDADTDFLPNFNGDNTGYDDVTGEIFWELEAGPAKATADVFQIVYVPDCEDCPVVLAQVPGADSSFQPPVDDLGITPSDADIVVVLGIDYPAGVDLQEYNPAGLLGYNSSAVNMWTNFDILGLLGGLF
ncbi:hypothetical protein K8I61_18940 [bacterium]|nr:hypothetical protein [bacterium]